MPSLGLGDSEAEIRTAFHAADIPPSDATVVIRRARQSALHHQQRRRSRLLAAGAAAAVIFLVGGGVTALTVHAGHTQSAGSGATQVGAIPSVSGWTARGVLVGDHQLIAHARAIIPGGNSNRAKVLYAGYLMDTTGRAVIFADQKVSGGDSTLYFVTSSLEPTAASQPRLLLRSSFKVPQTQHPQYLGFVAAESGTARVSNGFNNLAVALLAPGIRQATFNCALMESADTDSPTPGLSTEGLIVDKLADGASPWNTEVRITGVKQSKGTLGGGGGNELPPRATLAADSSGTLSLVGAQADVKPGDLVDTPAGVIGVVTSPVRSGSASISSEIVSALNKRLSIYSDISGYRGHLTQLSSGSLSFVPNASSTPAGVNHVVGSTIIGSETVVLNIGRVDPKSTDKLLLIQPDMRASIGESVFILGSS